MIKDDADIIVQKMRSAQVITFDAPVYFYEMSGQLKTMLDRTNPLFTSDYAFRDIYLLTAAAEEDESAMDGAIRGVKGWMDCFGKANLKKVIRGNGLFKIGDIKGSPLLLEAYTLGNTSKP